MATQLIDPFEREIRRTARRNDGFSDDGLSYSVANDFGKLWGQAMADYDARTAAPRSDVWGETLQEDTPAALRQQLLDPLTQRFGSDRQTTSRMMPAPRPAPLPPAPSITKSGSDTYMEDPLTRQWTKVVSGPKVEPKTTAGQRSELKLAEDDLIQARRALDKIPNDRDSVDERGDAVRRLRRAQLKHSGLTAPEAAIAEGPQGDELIAVVNPSGKPTKVKASDLERALQQGYQRR